MSSTAPPTNINNCAQCGQPAKSRCSGCKRYNIHTYYCSHGGAVYTLNPGHPWLKSAWLHSNP
jgi:hypothetical protein